jgi:ketosteroid isomerase-like protein
MNDVVAINQSTHQGDIIDVNGSLTQQTLAADRGLVTEIRAWLDRFAAAVRAIDYDAGRQLFAAEVIGFGTAGVRLQGLDALVALQWEKIWPVTSGFHFHMENLACGGEGDIAWAAVPWTSWGRRASSESFERHGRATYILHRRNGQWQALHSHHSLDPSNNTQNESLASKNV